MIHSFKVLVATSILCVIAAFTGFAQTKAITSVNIRCINNLEPGDILSDAIIDTSGENRGDINIELTNSNCYIDDCTVTGTKSRFIAAGDIITVKLDIESIDDSAYAFNGNYSSSNIKISGGTYQKSTAKKSTLSVTFTLTPVSGMLSAPYNAEWNINKNNLGLAKWSAEAGAKGYYDVWLYRGSTCIKKIEAVKALSYNFYPYMTKAGTYSFKVRCVPSSEQKKYAAKSEFMESDEYYLDNDHVSDGTGQDISNSNTVGWIKTGDIWYYKYPDGSLKKNGWAKISDKWYLFDAQGKMLTGLQTIASGTYYLAPSGDMQEGWIKIENKWHFFNNTPGSDTEGAMYKNTWINEPDGRTFYIGSDGCMSIGWKQIGEFWYHFGDDGNLSRNTIIETFYVDNDGKWIPAN